MNKRTTREQLLLTVAVFCVCGYGWQVLAGGPAERALMDARRDYGRVEGEYRAAQSCLERSRETGRERSKAYEEAVREGERFGPELEDYELERKVSGLLEASGFLLLEAEIRFPEETEAGAGNREGEAQPVLRRASVRVLVQGGEEALSRFLDAAARERGLYVKAFETGPEGEVGIEVDYYMAEPWEDGSAEEREPAGGTPGEGQGKEPGRDWREGSGEAEEETTETTGAVRWEVGVPEERGNEEGVETVQEWESTETLESIQ